MRSLIAVFVVAAMFVVATAAPAAAHGRRVVRPVVVRPVVVAPRTPVRTAAAFVLPPYYAAPVRRSAAFVLPPYGVVEQRLEVGGCGGLFIVR